MVLSHSHQAFVSVSIKLLVAVTEELGMNSLTIWSLLVVTCLAAPVACGWFGTFNDVVKMMAKNDPNCLALGLQNSLDCLNDLKVELSSSDDKSVNGTHNRTKCFSRAHLSECVEKAMNQHCVNLTEQMLVKVVEGAIDEMHDYSQCSIASVICLPGN